MSLETRFRSLDRVEPPDLWNEAVTRAAELDLARRRQPSRTLVLVAVALLLALLAGAIAIGAQLIWPAPDLSNERAENGMIVSVDQCGRLVRIDPGSGDSRELISGQRTCSSGEFLLIDTAWSSDGERLAYIVTPECGACVTLPTQESLDAGGAWIYDAGTGATRQLQGCPELFCEEGDISPDGSLVAFTAVTPAEDRWTLIVVEVAPGGTSRRIELPDRPSGPEFSPDGSRIVFGTEDSIAAGLFMVDLRSEVPEATSLYDDIGNYEGSPTWSPDGEQIAFEAGNGATTALWVMRADGTGARQLDSAPAIEGPGVPTWSPDGTHIAYVRTPLAGRTPDLQVGAVDGRCRQRRGVETLRVAVLHGEWRAPEWSPDGQYIAFGVGVGDDAADSGMAIIRADGTDLRWVSVFPMEADWQPIPQN